MRRCERCGEGFEATGAKQRYCGLSCAAIVNGARRADRTAAKKVRICTVCGNSFLPSRPNSKHRRTGYVQQTCSRRCAQRLKSAIRSASKAARPLPL
jgi:hypothetical protein